jgi:4-hydroxybutyrate dehydrogenase
VDEFNASMNIPKTLTERGVKDPDIEKLTAAALRDPSTGGNPIEMTSENTKALFEEIM